MKVYYSLLKISHFPIFVGTFWQKVPEFLGLRLNGQTEKEMPMKITSFFNKIYRLWEATHFSNQMVPFSSSKNYNTPMECSRTINDNFDRVKLSYLINLIYRRNKRGIMCTVNHRRLCLLEKIIY